MTRNIFIATIFALATAILLGIIFIGESQRLPESDAAIAAERVERGARDYEQYCASCHGLAGQGGVANGAPPINNIVAKYTTAGADGVAPFDAPNGIKEKYGSMRNYIRATLISGIRGTPMPAWAQPQGPMRLDQIENITSYVLSWNNNVPEAAIQAANLEATRMAPTPDPNANPVTAGEIVFKNKGCNGCHQMNDQKSAANAPGLGGLFQPGGTAAFGEELPNGKPVNDENVLDWIQKANVGYPDAAKVGKDGQEYGIMPGFALTDEEWQNLSVWLKAHNRDGSLTEEAQQIIQSATGGQAAPAQQTTALPTGRPVAPGAPNSGPGAASTTTP